MRFQLPVLPYDFDDLEPAISAEAMEFHYGRHHSGYIEKTNHLLEAPTAWQDELSLEEIVQTSTGPLFNNAAQAWNHTFFWHCLAPDAGGEPDGEVLEAIVESFGTFENFREKFSDKAAEVFGSGWTWLVKERSGRLAIVTTANGDTPIVREDIPLLVLDVWEHAYYIDYRYDRPGFIEAFWDLVNWDFVLENLQRNELPNLTKLMTAPTLLPRHEDRPQPNA